MSNFSELDQMAADALPRLSPAAGRFRNLVVCLGVCVLALHAVLWNSPDLIKYLTFLTVGLILTGSRATSPSGAIRLSPSLILILFGISELTIPEAVYMSAIVTLGPGLYRFFRGESDQPLAFEVALMAVGVGFSAQVFHSSFLADLGLHPMLRLAITTVTLFLLEMTPRIAFYAFDRSRPLGRLWMSEVAWAMTIYFGGAVAAFAMATVSQQLGWQTMVATGPAVYLVYRAYRLYLQRLEDQRRHAEEMASLHLRTIEALALAIEAKDNTTHDHLQRVQIYARELAKDLGLSEVEKEALLAASVLHDIGKLAVPEHIISKPGRLTPEEFDKMKIHPIVGAEILERVRFPYPVAPIVRTHHEKWDGTGYPAGIKGEEIPIGARILSAIDCLDALASDRQYRRALPLDEAMKVVRSESGKAFDPRVVDALSRRYVELERMAQGATPPKTGKLSTDVRVELGEAPAAGFENVKQASSDPHSREIDFLQSIASARQEVQTLFEISQDLGNSLSLDETLSVLSVKLRRIIPHHSLAIWLRNGDKLTPGYVAGEDYRLFSSLEIPVGQGLSGWVAENGKPIVNGNPTVESGYLNDSKITSTLRSAVAVPLDGSNGNVGVLALYHSERDAFMKDHLRVLNAINGKIGMAIENALRYRQAESTATTDYMTQLPNARSLFLQLDSELARAKRGERPLSVVVLDMNGLKTINDVHGHLVGNRVLGEVAQGLRSACREYDYVARMGGDEFVVLIPGTSAADMAPRIEQLRHVIAAAGEGLFPDRMLTASIGIASYPKDGSAAEQLLAEADRRMYVEKQASKDARRGGPNQNWVQQLSAIHREPSVQPGFRDELEAYPASTGFASPSSQKTLDSFAPSSL